MVIATGASTLAKLVAYPLALAQTSMVLDLGTAVTRSSRFVVGRHFAVAAAATVTRFRMTAVATR